MKKIDKLIVTNKSAILEKYEAQAQQVITLLKSLVTADRKNGLSSMLVFLDDQAQLKKLSVSPAVPSVKNQRLNKVVVDRLCQQLSPDYILIFGAVDIVPQIDLVNPLYKKGDDDDHHVKSDLPYASDATYSTDINDFLAVSRVVGRLPDINGVSDISYVKTVISAATGFVSQPAAVYKSYFAISAHVWHASTQLSVKNIFEDNHLLRQVPSDGPDWAGSQLRAMSHFVNCHGSPQDFHWYGQKGEDYPISVYSKQIDGKIKPGTIAAAECCYGAQLFDPGVSSAIKPICNTYLANGAVAFLGSSTIAYGPSSGNDQADLLTQYFMGNIIWNGASSGRALLEARQKYILNHGPDLSPTDLKSIAQFNLLGDPSIHPVKMASTGSGNSSENFLKKIYADQGRSERRKYLVSKGNSLKTFVNTVVPGKKIKVNKNSRKEIHEVLVKLNVRTREGMTFHVRQNATNKKAFQKSEVADAKYHIFSEKIVLNGRSKKNNAPGPDRYEPIIHTLTSIKELGGKVVNVQHYVRK